MAANELWSRRMVVLVAEGGDSTGVVVDVDDGAGGSGGRAVCAQSSRVMAANELCIRRIVVLVVYSGDVSGSGGRLV